MIPDTAVTSEDLSHTTMNKNLSEKKNICTVVLSAL